MSLALADLMDGLYSLTQDYMMDTSRKSYEGHNFENAVIEAISKHKEDHDLEVFDARTTLPLKTYSFLRHQLDGVFKHGSRYYFIECKHRKSILADHIGYFNSKLLDFYLGAHIVGLRHEIKGLFLASSPVGNNHLMYALAHGIIVIDPETPSLSHMISSVKNPDIKDALLGLYETIDPPFEYLEPPSVNPERLVKSYRYLVKQWQKDQGV